MTDIEKHEKYLKMYYNIPNIESKIKKEIEKTKRVECDVFVGVANEETNEYFIDVEYGGGTGKYRRIRGLYEEIEIANMFNFTYTWDELYEKADGCACGEKPLQAKDEARYEVCCFAEERNLDNPEDAEIPEHEVEDICDDYNIKFNIYGNIVEHSGLKED